MKQMGLHEQEKKYFYYKSVYIKNLIKYFFRKVRIPYFEVWVGQKCNLKCKNCCHLIPRVEQRCYDVDKLIGDCQKILTWCNVDLFSIVGGEPFCNPQLWKLLCFVSDCDGIRTGKIITNGTVLPDEQTLESLIRLNGKLEVRIDAYPGTEKKVEKFQRLMEANGIRHHITWFNPEKESSWKKLNPPNETLYSVKETKQRFHGCFVKTCSTLADGELTACPRGITSECVFAVKKNQFEHVQIRNQKNGFAAKARIATCIDNHMYKDYCRYCRSLSERNTCFVIPGEQVGQGKG